MRSIANQRMPLASHWVDVGGGTVHARVQINRSSNAYPVVLIHGIGVSSRYMLPTAIGLGDRFSVYAPDLPGFGLSHKPKDTLDVPALADALAAWMEAAQIPRAVLVGNSLSKRRPAARDRDFSGGSR